MHIFKDTNFDFLRWLWHAIAFSLIIIVAGIAIIVVRGSQGRRVRGGTVVIEKFQQPVTDQQVRARSRRPSARTSSSTPPAIRRSI